MVSIKAVLIVCVLVAAVAVSPADAVPTRHSKPRPQPLPRPGTCPDTSGIITTCEVTERNCFSDSQCGPGQKCCPLGCGRECLAVGPPYGKGRW
ncbi:chelonianin-like [Penaeus monodon]|uniref:Single whey acidic protein domain-containing protein isoform 2 n=1 Tax=Penaeus monodon TaxID=6687 RepID=B6S2X4_PENMO|nr:chelonianin-like [Penaeus monodon]ACF28465.1 single whey acidic protein domain-containing protein isoform 2 [Penaeus monodon]ACF28467.1 single whey acidic protein domain-containing protein isoform 2 [Penaeus monodon]